MGTTLVVDIADMKVSADSNAELVTYSLGSCIGVAIWDHQAHVGGLLHYMLSDSRLSPEKAKANPAMFADTGIPLLFRSAYELGAIKRRTLVKVAGGASLFETDENMNIGQHNYVMMRKIFWKNGVLIDGEHTGDQISRTMCLDVGTGRVTVENRKMGLVEI
ncbi:MAG: chemotaxis protein CheD [Phycisphaerales bacterium]|nr:MAG: chemotaxis protein CheD [Phycisphaerales bacterium]